jgi:hypothetical protein
LQMGVKHRIGPQRLFVKVRQGHIDNQKEY